MTVLRFPSIKYCPKAKISLDKKFVFEYHWIFSFQMAIYFTSGVIMSSQLQTDLFASPKLTGDNLTG